MDRELPLTKNHKVYKSALANPYPVLCIGSQGTGKTYGACEQAVAQLRSKSIRKIIVSRPNVPFADTLGLLPGTDQEKLEPWVKPVKQIFEQLIPATELELYEKSKVIEYQPFESIQGLTFDNAFIILDECQNITFSQLKIFLGRQGMHSKTVLCGDVKQTSDMFKNSGLAELVDMIKTLESRCNIIDFTLDDCVRSPQCKEWLEDFEDWDELQEEKARKLSSKRKKVVNIN